MGIEIKITGASPLDALATVTAFGIHCMADNNVADAARRIVETAHAPSAPQMRTQAPASVTTPPAPAITPTEAFQPVTQAPAPASTGAPTDPPMPGTGQNTMTTSQTSLFNQQPNAAPVSGYAPAAPQSSGQYPQSVASMGTPPLSGAPGFTVPQISKAGADLVTSNPAKMAEVNALLQKYGVQSLQELKPNQLGAVALELRGLGANI